MFMPLCFYISSIRLLCEWSEYIVSLSQRPTSNKVFMIHCKHVECCFLPYYVYVVVFFVFFFHFVFSYFKWPDATLICTGFLKALKLKSLSWDLPHNHHNTASDYKLQLARRLLREWHCVIRSWAVDFFSITKYISVNVDITGFSLTELKCLIKTIWTYPRMPHWIFGLHLMYTQEKLQLYKLSRGWDGCPITVTPSPMN